MSNEELVVNVWKRERPKRNVPDDRQNVFECADKTGATAKVPRPATEFEDDRQNAFDRHDSVMDARKKFSAEHDASEREAQRQAQRRTWTRESAPMRTTGGTIAGDQLVELKKASDADRAARRNATPVVIPPTSLVVACIEAWQRSNPYFYESEFNYRSLVNYIVSELARGTFVLSVESVQQAYVYLINNGYLESAPSPVYDGVIIRARGSSLFSSKPAPVLYPPHVWPAELQAEREHEIAEYVTKYQADAKAAEQLPFEQLKDQVRQTYKAPTPGGPNLDRS